MDQSFDEQRSYPPHVHDSWADTLAQQRERLAQAGRDGYGTDAYSYPGMNLINGAGGTEETKKLPSLTDYYY